MTWASRHLNVEMQMEVVVPRLSPRGRLWRNGPNAHDYGDTTQAIELFLPYDRARHGNIAIWSLGDGHSEASLAYYMDTQPPYSRMEEVAALVERYRRLLDAVLVGPFTLEVRKRLPTDWRDHAWRR